MGISADVHGNLVALERVIEHAKRQGVDAWWFLGDVVGYGPQPVDCILALDVLPVAAGGWLMGNHDMAACLLEPLGKCHVERLSEGRRWQVGSQEHLSKLIPGADDLEVAAWHAGQLGVGLTGERLAKFKAAPTWNVVEDGVILAHGIVWGAPTDAENVSEGKSLIFPNDVLKPGPSFCQAARQRGVEIEMLRLLIVGHTHVPMLQQGRPIARGAHWDFSAVNEPRLDEPLPLGVVDERQWAAINPGSVGQPRNGDPRAAYAILDTEDWSVRFHRVEYSIHRTQAAMIPFYPEVHRKRLEKGE